MEKFPTLENNYNLLERFERNPVLFLPEQSVVTFEDVERIQQEAGTDTLYACDFAIENIEEYEKDGYFQRKGVINIDHHSESPNFKKHISSANLALRYIASHPEFLTNSRVLTHHTDCDSILSTSLMSGILPPEEKFGIAAIAADHTGEANEIADLLQALKGGPGKNIKEKSTPEENREKYLYSLAQLQNLLSGKELDGRAQELLQMRLEERDILRDLVENGSVKVRGDAGEVAYLETDNERLDATLLTGLLPRAKVIFIARNGEHRKTIANVRLGKSAPSGMDLRDIMNAIKEPFGGRWNAGANKRRGGTDSSPEEIADKIVLFFNPNKSGLDK